jgi:hypothetical protein
VFQLDDFIAQGHQKIIDHYRWLRDSAKTEAERERFQQRMLEEYEVLKRYTEQRSRAAHLAA